MQETSHSRLLADLWDAAVNLRGSIEPADYKRYVLPLIFLRFLSLRYDRRRAELEALTADPTSEYYCEREADRLAVLEDPDEYRAAGAFVVPEPARWDVIVSEARRTDIRTRMDSALKALEDAYPDKLRGLIPPVYGASNLDAENLRGLIDIFSRQVFSFDHGGEDMIGRVYEYFIGEFANSEGKRGGEYFTPLSIVRTLVAMLKPTQGVVLDPCCGSGGMFVQSDLFTGHNHGLSFVGQESKDFTYRLCRMNLFIHGIDGNIQLGSSYDNDKHPGLKADYVIANPPFNDGAKSRDGWGADRIAIADPRLHVDGQRLPLAPRNANTMWMLHFLYHLKDGGSAAFVMATGELSHPDTARATVRRALVDGDYVDCIVQMSGQFFANTQVPCSLWILSRARGGSLGTRRRNGQVLFIDARDLGSLIPGSRKQKMLSDDEIERISGTYRQFVETPSSVDCVGFSKVATTDDIRRHKYGLEPGRYVGTAVDVDDVALPAAERVAMLAEALRSRLEDGAALRHAVDSVLDEVSAGA